MRHWTRLLLGMLGVCLVALASGLFILERRISDLEAQLTAARSEIAAAAKSSHAPPLTVALAPSATQRIPVQPPAWSLSPTPEARHPLIVEQVDGQTQVVVPPEVVNRVLQRERKPSGEINGVPYYVIPLGITKE